MLLMVDESAAFNIEGFWMLEATSSEEEKLVRLRLTGSFGCVNVIEKSWKDDYSRLVFLRMVRRIIRLIVDATENGELVLRINTINVLHDCED